MRRVRPDALEPLHRLLAGADTEAYEWDSLVGGAEAGGVFELNDVTRGPGAVPVAVALFYVDRPRRAARLEHVLVGPGWRRAGLGRRLLGEAAVLLRADGIESVEALSDTESPGGLFLRAVGFEAAADGIMLYQG